MAGAGEWADAALNHLYTSDMMQDMDATSPISARVDGATLSNLDRLAERYDRSRSWLVAQAVREYVDRETEFLEFVGVGEEEIAKGNFFTQDEMEVWLEERIAKRTGNAAARS